jgi:hypothetical protein
MIPALQAASLRHSKILPDGSVASRLLQHCRPTFSRVAAAGFQTIINRHYQQDPERVEMTVESDEFGPTRVNARPLEPNRFGRFSRKVAYTGWSATALHDTSWFDSTPERTLANILDSEKGVALWARIQRDDRQWARFVTDSGDHGKWRYLLLPEEVLDTA